MSYEWNITPGKKCKGCYTTTGVYYRYTNLDGELAQSCEKCLDKVRKMLEDKGVWEAYSSDKQLNDK
jgi:hypothetical protein